MTLLLLFACNGPGDSKPLDDTGATPSGTTAGTPTGGTGTGLPDCTPTTGTSGRIALSGVVLAPDGPIGGSVVYDPAAGTIACVGDCDVSADTVVCTGGVISPGLLDLHNHLQYNTLPPLQVGPEFTDRYDWREDDRYWDYRTAYDEIYDSYTCEIMKWAEIRELVHGTTSAVGSSGGDCIHLLVRNLDEDEDAHGLDGYALDYSSSTVTDSLDEGDGEDVTADLASGALDAAENHVGEGKDGSVRDEIEWMFDIGLAGPGNIWVHATDITTDELARLASEGAGLLWSPRSNLGLYGTTTPVEIATKLGVPWAIGTDWTPSGTMAPSRELACAKEWLGDKGGPLTDQELWQKVTSDAARIANLDGIVGSLEPGLRADIAVFSYGDAPYAQVIGAGADDVRLVIVGGQALYGDTELVTGLAAHPEWCETLDPCGAARTLCVKAADSGDDSQSYAELEDTLTAALSGASMPSGYEYGAELYPVFACEDEVGACSLAEPTTDDPDGDGVTSGDVCPDLYDPNQWDTDGDGLGDDCDDCPLAEGTCTTTTADVDGDGAANDTDNCPYEANADQADLDQDGLGDVCDPCPEDASAYCSTTVGAIRDPSDPSHLPEGSGVSISGVVVTAIRVGSGFFVQDPAASEYGGLYVYDQGAATVSLGDVVSVEGTYTEYYEMSELTSPSVTVTATAEVPAAILVDACSVATGGADAERYEGMLVDVGAVSVTNVNADDPEDYDEFEVAGCLRVDDFLWDELDQPADGTSYTDLRGVLIYSFDNAKLAPRDADDMP